MYSISCLVVYFNFIFLFLSYFKATFIRWYLKFFLIFLYSELTTINTPHITRTQATQINHSAAVFTEDIVLPEIEFLVEHVPARGHRKLVHNHFVRNPQYSHAIPAAKNTPDIMRSFDSVN